MHIRCKQIPVTVTFCTTTTHLSINTFEVKKICLSATLQQLVHGATASNSTGLLKINFDGPSGAPTFAKRRLFHGWQCTLQGFHSPNPMIRHTCFLWLRYQPDWNLPGRSIGTLSSSSHKQWEQQLANHERTRSNSAGRFK